MQALAQAQEKRHDSAMTTLFGLFLFLLLARAFGSAADHLRVPTSVGEMSAGVLIAYLALTAGDMLPFLPAIVHDDLLAGAADVAVFFLVLLVGVEMEPGEIAKSSGRGLGIALGGMLVPLVGGAALAWTILPASDMHDMQALVTGVVLSITALPVVAKVLTDFAMLRTRAGEMIITAALFDDILGLVLIAILLAVLETGAMPALMDFTLLLAKVAGFFGITILLGAHVYPHLTKRLRLLDATAIEFSALVTAALGYGWLAELLGLHWVMGAFMAGLYFEKSRVGARSYMSITAVINTMVQGVLGPLFFLSMGLYIDLAVIADMPITFTLLLAFAILSKLVGAGLPALLMGMGRREAMIIGTGMGARGVVGLVVVGIAYDAGLFTGNGANPAGTALLSALVLVSVLTTALTPLFLQGLLRGYKWKKR